MQMAGDATRKDGDNTPMDQDEQMLDGEENTTYEGNMTMACTSRRKGGRQ